MRCGRTLVVLAAALCASAVMAADWTRTYGRSADAAAVTQVQLGQYVYVLTCCVNDSGNKTAVVIRYDKDGDPAPPVRPDTWAYAEDYVDIEPVDLVVDAGPEYSYIYVAAARKSGGSSDYLTVQFNALQPGSSATWARVYDNGASDAPAAIALFGYGVVVTGTSYRGNTGDDYFTIAYSPSNESLWARRLNRAGTSADSARAIVVGEDDGNICVTGVSWTGTTASYVWTVAMDEDGARLWTQYYPVSPSAGVDLDWMCDDSGEDDVYLLFVTGICWNSAQSVWKTVTLCYDAGSNAKDADGDLLGSVTYDGKFGYHEKVADMTTTFFDAGDDYHRYVGLTLSEESQAGSPTAIRTLLYEFDGSNFDLGWEKSRGISGSGDGAKSICADDAANFYVAGNATRSTRDVATMKYDVNGGLRYALTTDVGTNDDVRRACFVDDPGTGYLGWMAFSGSTGTAGSREVFVCRRDVPTLSLAWTEVRPMPELPSGKAVKYGGWLASDPSDGLIYAAKGNKTGDFYWYSPATDSWSPTHLINRLELIPLGIEGKLPYKGSAGCADGAGHVYMTKGYNTPGFHCYDIAKDSWDRRNGFWQPANVPLGLSNKKVKGGTDMVWAVKGGVGNVYLLKGYKNEFYRYNPAVDSWYTMAPAPVGSNVKWDKGSWLAYDGSSHIYAHKAKYHEFYRYNVESDSWSAALNAMPIPGANGGKKSKDGGCGVWLDGRIYALKGGNTQEFWRYSTDDNSWTQLETLPRIGFTGKRKKVKDGGDMACAFGLFYALKGNKTREFWRYVPDQSDGGGLAGFPSTSPGGGRDNDESPVMEGIEAYGPRWRSDGQAVIVSHEDSIGYLQIYEVSYSNGIGTETRIVEVAADCEEPSYSNQGDRVCFTIDTGFCQIAVVDLDTSYGREGMDGAEANAAPVQAVSATGTTPGPRAFGDISIITSGPYDHTSPSFSPSDDQICYVRESDDGDDDIWLIPANGGDEEQLTACGLSHESPVWLSDNEVAFIHLPDDDFDQVGKVIISNSTEMDLTWSEYDHARPDATETGTTLCFEVFDDDGTQVGRVCSDGGDETILTTGTRDMEAPDWANSSSIFCARWTGITSAICRVDAINGGYTAITDSSAIRDNPDGWYDQNGSTSYVIFERESWDPLDLFGDGNRKKKWGTGVFLKRFRQPHDGAMGAGLYAFALERAKPNPVRSRATICWQVPVLGDVSLKVYSTAGQLVKVLADGRTKPGAYTSVWNGTDAGGRRLAAGVYFYTLDNGSKRIGRKVVLTE
jgi:hypothetical protein